MTRKERLTGIRQRLNKLRCFRKEFHYRDDAGTWCAVLTISASGGVEYSRGWVIAGPGDIVYYPPDDATIAVLDAMHAAATGTSTPVRSVGSPFGYEPEDCKNIIGEQEET